MTNKTTGMAAETPETALGYASPESKIGKYLEGLASQIGTRYGRKGLRSRTFAIDYNFAQNGADGTIYQCNKVKDHQAALDAGLRIRGEKVVINTEASLMDGSDFGSVHLSRFHSGDPMALILSIVRGLAIGNVAANRGRTGHISNAAVAIKSKSSTGCEDYYAATGGIVIGKKWGKVALVDISIEPGSWLDSKVEALATLIQENGIVAPRDNVLLDGTKAGGDQTRTGETEETEETEDDSLSDSLGLNFADIGISVVLAHYGVATKADLAVLIQGEIKARINSGKVPLKSVG